MSKSTAAVILTSPARLAPWGDDAWRFTGAMQLVADGPDWLHARWTVPGAAAQGTGALDSMVLRDEPRDRAADIAVMALALLQVSGVEALEPWWQDVACRDDRLAGLERLMMTARGQFKLAVVETRPGAVPDGVRAALVDLGFEVVWYAERQ